MADLLDRLVLRGKTERVVAPALDEEAVHQAQRLRDQPGGVQRPRSLELLLASRAEPCEREQNLGTIQLTEQRQPLPRLSGRTSLERTESRREERGIELGRDAPRQLP